MRGIFAALTVVALAACGPPKPGSGSIHVDVTAKKHVVSPLLFGDQIETPDIKGFWDSANQRPYPDVEAALRKTGIHILRYPGGTPSDFFHWQETVGPVDSRKPQVNPFETSSDKDLRTYPVPFGPDEFAAFASDAGYDMLITANVGTGTADEAAAWLAHYEDGGVRARYWEIGNEVWITTDSYSAKAQHKTPEEYAAVFDAYAKALRAVRPDVKVGLTGCHDNGAFPLCQEADWNQRVLANVKEKFDFFSVHNSYAPATGGPWVSSETEKVNKAMLAAPDMVSENFDLQQRELDDAGKTDVPFAVTEHAAFFIGAFDGTILKMYERDRCLAAALFSATEYNLFLGNGRIFMTEHLKAVSAYWQSLITTAFPDEHSRPFISTYGRVVKLYSEASNGTVVESHADTDVRFDSEKVGIVPERKDVSALSALAVVPQSGEDKVWVYVVNRDLHRDVEATLDFGSLSVGAISADVLDADDYYSVSTADAPDNVSLTTHELGAASAVTFPAHSLTRLRVR